MSAGDPVEYAVFKDGQEEAQGAGLGDWPSKLTHDVVPKPCHSHNDYWRKAPLYSALSVGCSSVEADVWLYEDELYVGHDKASLSKSRTLKSLYIDPLVWLLEHQNPTTEFGRTTRRGVFDTDPDQTLVLLIDVKTAGHQTWPWVVEQLHALRARDWLSVWNGSAVIPGPITVVGTGETPFDLIADLDHRDYFFDAPLERMWDAEDLGESEDEKGVAASRTTTVPQPSPSLPYTDRNSYYASASFVSSIGQMSSVGGGQSESQSLSNEQLALLRGQIRAAHRRGLRARYWDLPAWPINLRNYVWDLLVREGVDVLNVDDIQAAAFGVWA